MQVLFKRTSEHAILPKQANPGDAGYDVFSAENYQIPPGATCLVNTGWNIHPGVTTSGDAAGNDMVWVVKVCSRSGLALKHGISVANSPGIIDSQYTGPLGVILKNSSNKEYVVSRGDRVAQLLVERVYLAAMVEVEEMPQTVRGETGFGASGR